MPIQKKHPGDGQYHIPDLTSLDPSGDAYVFDDDVLKERVVVWTMRGTDQDGGHRFSGWIKLMSCAIRPEDEHTAGGLLWQRSVDDRSLISTETLAFASGLIALNDSSSWQKFMTYIKTVGPFGT